MTAGFLQQLAERSEDKSPFLNFLERSWSRHDLWQEAGRAAGGLSALGLSAKRPLGILLPNLPGAVTALLAIWLAGQRPALVDGRQAMPALHRWAAEKQPAAVVTLDLASVFERARALAAVTPSCRLIVMPIADQLGFWKRIIAPWLRGGGAAKRPDDTEFLAWSDLLHAGAAGELPSDPAGPPEIQAWPQGAKGLITCPLSAPEAQSALVSAWCGEGRLILSPRLDQRSLDKVRKASRPDLEVTAEVSRESA